MQTPWGYEVEELPPLVSAEEFAAATGGAYGTGERVEAALNAASQAVRNWCGWHVSPSLRCTALLTPEGRHAKLPAGYVSDLTASGRDGDEWAELEGVEWRHDGLLRRRSGLPCGWDSIKVEYAAGFDPAAVPDLAATVVGVAEGVLTASKGVASESADGVSITYAASAQGIASALTSQMGAQLAPYRLVSSHAA